MRYRIKALAVIAPIVVALALVITLGAPTSAQMSGGNFRYHFYKNSILQGWFGTINDNELELNTVIQDPVKFRFAIHRNKVESNLGGLSFNRSRDDGQHDEDAIIMGRMTADKRGGAIWMGVRPDNGNNDEPVREVFYIDDNVAIFRVPIQAPGLGSGPSTPTVADKMTSNNGRFVTVQQGDGNFVTYDLTLGVEGDPKAAIWSAWQGKIR